MSLSFANADVNKMELTPMRVKFKSPGAASAIDLGGTLDNVVISMAYKKSDIKFDQLGTTVADRRVSGIEIKVTTSLAEIQNKDIFKIVFPHATQVPKTLTGGTITAASPAVATFIAHGLRAGDKFQFTTGTVPTGVSLDTDYYVISTGLTANDFEFALTPGGSAINGTGSAGSGDELTTTTSGAIDWNSAIGDGDQVNAGELSLHPLSKDNSDVDTDWTFFKACADATSELSYGPEGQLKLKCVWNILPDLSTTPARFFRYGDTTLV